MIEVFVIVTAVVCSVAGIAIGRRSRYTATDVKAMVADLTAYREGITRAAQEEKVDAETFLRDMLVAQAEVFCSSVAATEATLRRDLGPFVQDAITQYLNHFREAAGLYGSDTGSNPPASGSTSGDTVH